MALPHRSIAVETGVEFINLEPLDINPLMSACEIKVFYLGKNRNHTFISKEVATEMAKSLRGAPIVGYFRKDKDDFDDHGQQIVMDSDGIHFNCLTVPYGFVSPDSKVWFQDFEEEDDFGNKVIRTYLMTTGYLWTEQFEEAKKVFEDDGKPQSMEIDKKSVEGHWAEDFNDNIEFFIISDAIFSKLCILGDDTEPCFEGAAVTDLNVSTKFTLDDKFKNTLFSMMNELKQVLKGDISMPDNEVMNEQQTNVEPTTEFEESGSESSSSSETGETTTGATESNTEGNTETGATEGNTSTTETEGNTNEQGQEQGQGQTQGEGQGTGGSQGQGQTQGEGQGQGAGQQVIDPVEEVLDPAEDSIPSKGKKEQFALEYEELQESYNKLQTEFAELKSTLENLAQFKNNVEDKQKDELISKFYMLSDEDKKDVIEHKNEYTLDEIESKLAVIGFRKGINFSYQDNTNETNEINDTVTTFELNGNEDNSIPEWVKAVKENEQ